MKGDLPDAPRYGEVDRAALGALLEHSCAPRLRRSLTPNKEEIIARLARGEATFIYDSDGAFIIDSFIPVHARGDA